MLNHLIATIMICLGVANTTPISNYKENHVLTATKKKATIVNNYTITPEETTNNDATYVNQATGNTFYPNGEWYEQYYRYQANNSYINTITEEYNSRIFANTSNATIPLWQVKDQTETEYATRVAYFYKLTPYNYNINTEIQIKNSLQIFEIQGWDITGLQIKRTIYQSTENDWDQFIGRQISKNQTWTTKQQIEDINNGFYYTKEEEIITTINQTNINADITDDITINITPDNNNYIYIIYTPELIEQTVSEEKNIIANGYIVRYGTTPTKITGTNIIPDGTYEIVDIPGMMFEILGMPFAFVSQAFNLTLFPGTPYQINIANLFLSIIAIFVFVWLLLIFIKMKSGG